MQSPKDAAEAIAIQQSLRARVRIEDDFPEIHLIAGIDVGHSRAGNSRATIALMRPQELKPLEIVTHDMPTEFPYIPGLLSFREIPVILKALKKLSRTPDIFMVDGQGIAHPRRLGIAAHLGVITDMPAIGVAKSRLTGTYAEPGLAKGSTSELAHKGEKIGTVLRSKERSNPLFISPGHRVSHETALELTIACLTRYRLPEPTRIADKYSKQKT